MKKYQKSILFIFLSLVFLVGSFVFLKINKDYLGYAILGFTFAGIFMIVGIISFLNNRNPSRFYESKVKDILNTYDSILVKSSSVPALEGRNIILVDSIEDLIDAQLELRKPICYLKQTESCSFILLDDREAYIYTEKLNDSVESPVDIELNEIRISNKNAEEMDSEMLRDIEKTTIVKLSNRKSYKVSPVRKNKPLTENNSMDVPTEVVAPTVEVPNTMDVPTEVVVPPVEAPNSNIDTSEKVVEVDNNLNNSENVVTPTEVAKAPVVVEDTAISEPPVLLNEIIDDDPKTFTEEVELI